jgi:hypothetical protein
VVVGEEEDGAVPAVTPVAADFSVPLESQQGFTQPTDEDGDLLIAPVEEQEPSRRERRRARRREKRLARGRRLITFRTLIFVIILAAVVVGGFAAIRWYNVNSYYVGVQDNELIIYQGRIGGFLWYHPTAVERTGVTLADTPGIAWSDLQSGVEETSVSDARQYVSNLVAQKQDELNPGASTSPSTTAASTTTTTKPGTTTTTKAKS